MFSYDLLFHLATYGEDLSISQPPPALGITIPLSRDLSWVSAGQSPFQLFLLLSCAFSLSQVCLAPAAPVLVLQAYWPPPQRSAAPPKEGSVREVLLPFIAYLSIFQNSTNQGYVYLTNFSKGLKIRNVWDRKKLTFVINFVSWVQVGGGGGLYPS